MTTLSGVFRVGTRPSRLALTQTRNALVRLEDILPGCSFEPLPIASIGDRDRSTDLRQSPADFFTRELDRVLLDGEIDCAIHSAKDLPPQMPQGIDWFWLPEREEPRDVLIAAAGCSVADLPESPVIGVSSDRRSDYASKRFPQAVQKPIRGNIEERIAQLDDGDYDLIIMAAAALVRLNLEERISEWISLEELPVPDGQGYPAVTFRASDTAMQKLRGRFVKSVTFAGAGAGGAESCSIAALHELRRCDICLYDSLSASALLKEIPASAQAIDVGKRCGAHTMQQDAITVLICDLVRQGRKVVRLKGGDPGIFGRLAEETEALQKLHIPFRVIPGISALQMATTATGMLLTRRGESRGFCAMTPRRKGGGTAPVTSAARAELPIAMFMSIKASGAVTEELIRDGMDPQTPAAVVFGAGSDSEKILRSPLCRIAEAVLAEKTDQPGLLLIGSVTRHGFATDSGALGGRRILLTCSEALQQQAADCVRDFGGYPVQRPLISLQVTDAAVSEIRNLEKYNWIILTSPSAVRCFMEIVHDAEIDLRRIPKIMVCGSGSARALKEHGLIADAMPQKGYSAEALLETARGCIKSTDKILRLRSAKAGIAVTQGLRSMGAEVEDCIIYTNQPLMYDALPEFDAIFFASASAVEVYLEQWGAQQLQNKTILTIGRPTVKALESAGLKPTLISTEATVPDAISTLASFYIVESI